MQAPSRFLDPVGFEEYQKHAGHKPTTRLNTALKARKAAIDELTPLIEAREKIAKRITALEAEYKNPATIHSREMEISKELTERYGLYAQRSILNEDISEAHKRLDLVEKRVRSAQKEIDEAKTLYVNARTKGYEESLVYKIKCENQIAQAKKDAESKSNYALSESKRLLKERKDTWGNPLSNEMIIAKSAALKRDAKKVLEDLQSIISDIETDAKTYNSNCERRCDSTHKNLRGVGGTIAVKEAEELVNRKLASIE
jgi:hypothetical protein